MENKEATTEVAETTTEVPKVTEAEVAQELKADEAAKEPKENGHADEPKENGHTEEPMENGHAVNGVADEENVVEPPSKKSKRTPKKDEKSTPKKEEDKSKRRLSSRLVNLGVGKELPKEISSDNLESLKKKVQVPAK